MINRRKKPEIILIGLVMAYVTGLIGCTVLDHPLADYQNATVQRCGFRPSADTVRGILDTKNELFKDPDTMALAICASQRSPQVERKRSNAT